MCSIDRAAAAAAGFAANLAGLCRTDCIQVNMHVGGLVLLSTVLWPIHAGADRWDAGVGVEQYKIQLEEMDHPSCLILPSSTLLSHTMLLERVNYHCIRVEQSILLLLVWLHVGTAIISRTECLHADMYSVCM